MEATTTQPDLLIKMTITAWEAQNTLLNQLIASISDEQLANEVAPGKNTGIYLLGHLVAVSDGIFPILGFGERIYPALDHVFVDTPDKRGLSRPSVAELKAMLGAVNAKLSAHFQSATANEWLSRHNAVSVEDFIKQPHRNKLNVVINRTNHMAYHLGQLALLKLK